MSLERTLKNDLRPINQRSIRNPRFRNHTIDYNKGPSSLAKSYILSPSQLDHLHPLKTIESEGMKNISVNLPSNTSIIMKRRSLIATNSRNSNEEELCHSCPHCKQPIENLRSVMLCQQHQIAYELIGLDKNCQHSCMICCQCLKEDRHQHKRGCFNHQTIPISKIRLQFETIKHHNEESIHHAFEMLDGYISQLKSILWEKIEKQEERMKKFIENIMLIEITQSLQQLPIMNKLYFNDYSQLSCKDIGSVAQKLLNHKAEVTSSGYSMLQDYLSQRQLILTENLRKIVESEGFQSATLKDVETETNCPSFTRTTQLNQNPQDKLLHISNISLLKSSVKNRKKDREIKSVDKKAIILQPLWNQKPRLRTKSHNEFPASKRIDFPGSQIIKSQTNIQFIQKLFEKKRLISTKMLFRASDHNFSVKLFHQLCDNIPNTIVFVRTEFKKIIGGFTTIPWKSSKNTIHADKNKQSFLFSVSMKQKMPLIDDSKAIFNSITHGPIFGAGADLAICHKADMTRQSYANFPHSYGSCRYKQNSNHSSLLFTGQNNGKHFYLEEWEVWKIQLRDQ